MAPNRRSSLVLLASLASLWALPARAQGEVEVTLTVEKIGPYPAAPFPAANESSMQ